MTTQTPTHTIFISEYVTPQKTSSFASVIVDNEEIVDESTFEEYQSIVGKLPDKTSSMIAILHAFYETFQWLMEDENKDVVATIITKNAFIVKALRFWASNWAQNGWLKKDGNPIKNLEYMKTLFEMYQDLSETVELKNVMVKSHDDTLEAKGTNVAFNEAKKAIKTGPKIDVLKPSKEDGTAVNAGETGTPGIQKKENEAKKVIMTYLKRNKIDTLMDLFEDEDDPSYYNELVSKAKFYAEYAIEINLCSFAQYMTEDLELIDVDFLIEKLIRWNHADALKEYKLYDDISKEHVKYALDQRRREICDKISKYRPEFEKSIKKKVEKYGI